jgi:ABC-type Fe3+ transport system permease subunit
VSAEDDVLSNVLVGDVFSYEQRQELAAQRKHELQMRSTRLKLAKIEAKRDVRVARSRNTDFLIYRWCCIAVVCLLVFLLGIIAYNAIPTPTTVLDHKQAVYEKCMEVEQKADNCLDVRP